MATAYLFPGRGAQAPDAAPLVRQHAPDLLETCIGDATAFAGHSLGELSALAAAGALDEHVPCGEIGRDLDDATSSPAVAGAGGGTRAGERGRPARAAEDRSSLYLSPHTVKEHTSSLYRKLEVRNRAEAVQRAQRLGLLA